MKKIVLFDMDGTLIDSAKDITSSINFVRLQNHNLEPLNEKFVVDIINAPVRNLAMSFYNTELYEKRDHDLFEAHYEEECVKNVSLYNGVHTMLDTLHTNSCYLGVATNAPTKFAKIMLKHLEVEKYFSNIFGVEDRSLAKPHPYMLQEHLSLANYNHVQDSAFMVGDNSKDIDAAKNAAIASIFVTWGFSSVGSAEYLVKEPKELVDIVLN